MTKTVCDGCGKEVTPNSRHTESWRKIEFASHLVEGNSRAYVTPEGEPVSGRLIGYDLCPKCYNAVGFVAIRELRSIQTANAGNK